LFRKEITVRFVKFPLTIVKPFLTEDAVWRENARYGANGDRATLHERGKDTHEKDWIMSIDKLTGLLLALVVAWASYFLHVF
jgi:hypothetical protein